MLKQMMEIKDFCFVKVKRCGKKQMMEIKDFFFVKVKRCGNRGKYRWRVVILNVCIVCCIFSVFLKNNSVLKGSEIIRIPKQIMEMKDFM